MTHIPYNVGDVVKFRWYGNIKIGVIVMHLLEPQTRVNTPHLLIAERTNKKRKPRLIAIAIDCCGLELANPEEIESLDPLILCHCRHQTVAELISRRI